MQRDQRVFAWFAFAMYFLTGAVCIVVGSSLPQLVKMYEADVSQVVLLGSSFALGRTATVYFTGKMVEKFGAVRILGIGVALLGCYVFGIPTFVNFYAGLAFAFLGGAGMGVQDTVCPVFLSEAFPKNYAGSMSAGQAFYGLGNFTTPFLVGIMLKGQLPFYYSYYVLAAVAVIILISIFVFRRGTLAVRQNETDEETQYVKPLITKRRLLSYILIVLGDITYCATVNGIMTYTSSYAESLGVDPASSAFMLTVYNVGCLVGSAAFTVLLKKFSERKVLLFNSVAGAVAIFIMLRLNSVPVFFVCLAVAGFFFGVLFSVYVTIATRIDYKHVSRAGSIIGTAGGGSDILTPIITGAMVTAWGIGSAFTYVMIVAVISIVIAGLLFINTSDREE